MQAHGMACTVCHVPSPEGGAIERAAWWSPQETGVDFEMYVTSAGNSGTLNGPSMLCLSCHDGVTAPDEYGGKTGASILPPGRATLGVDLSNDHPIGIAYPPRNGMGQPLDGYYLQPRGDVSLTVVDGTSRVECTSCHDPHGTSYDMMLRETVAGSAICFGCHDL
jgi:predicted CXXCH cytochrome family protein